MLIENLDSKFEHHFKIISSQSFLKMEALGGEVPFFISAYNPSQQTEVDSHIKALKNRLTNQGIEVCEINLFEISIKLLEERGLLQKILQKESGLSKEKLFETLSGVLDIEKYLNPYLEREIINSNAKVVFLTGIGLVYPFIRSHNILNNFQSIVKTVPLVMYFPGIYTGRTLELFGKIKDDNYYRAFNIDSINQ